MNEVHRIDYLDAVTHAAQYLAGMRPGANRWVEFGEMVRHFFDADLVAVARRSPGAQLLLVYASPIDEETRTRLVEAVRTHGAPVLDSGFLSVEALELPEPYSVAFLPLAQNHRLDALLIIGQKGGATLPRDVLDVYLAVSGLMESTLARLGFEEQLRLRAREQAGVATLGHRALEGGSIDGLMDDAVRRVAAILEVDYCALLELLPEGNAFLLRAGFGWKEGFVARATLGAGPDTQPGFVLHSGKATVQKDIRAETRFVIPSVFLEHGIVSSAAAPLIGHERPLGVMSVHTTTMRAFVDDELTFLQSAANVIAAAWERKQAEEALRQSELRFRALFEHARDGIVVLDGENGRIVDCNGEFVRMTGRSREDLFQMAIWQLCPPELVEQARAAFYLVRDPGRTARSDLDFVRPDGTRVPIELSSQPLVLGGRQYIQSICRDVSERRRAEEALRAREQEFRALAEHSPDVITRFDRALRRIYANPAIQTVLGRPASAIVGKTNRELGVPEALAAFWDEHVRQVFAEGTEGRMESVVPAHDGEIHLESRLVPEFGPDGTVRTVLAITRDITARKCAEDALQSSNAELEKALKELRAAQQQMIQSEKLAALGTLAAGVAHELNNPLMGVMGYVTFAREQSGEQGTKQLLEKAGRELERMRDLLKNMLGFARPIESQLTRVEIATVLERALALLQPELKAGGIRVVTDIPADLPPVMAEENFLQQVFLNLLLNARDALEAQPARTVGVRARQEAAQVIVEITDTGPGVPPEVLGRIFDPFFTTKPPGRGTGLGLSIARNIVTDFGGSITCDCREGEGATFTVALRRADDHTGGKAP